MMMIMLKNGDDGHDSDGDGDEFSDGHDGDNDEW